MFSTYVNLLIQKQKLDREIRAMRIKEIRLHANCLTLSTRLSRLIEKMNELLHASIVCYVEFDDLLDEIEARISDA